MAPAAVSKEVPVLAPNGRSSPAHPPLAPPAQAAGRIGPHPGFISSSNQYSSEIKIRRLLKNNGCDPAREDNYRLQGVQLIDNVREHLQLPVRTFDTACTYYHKFRLSFRDSEYNYQDAALASLFVACKVEDTIKKSKDILAAAYNVKNLDKPVAGDDKIFESPGKVIIGLERLILETIGFDFRTRYPQKLLAKVVRSLLGRSSSAAKSFFATAYAMSTDMYKTFVPIKRNSFAMVMAIVELTARLRAYCISGGESSMEDGDETVGRVHRFASASPRRSRQYSRDAIAETMLDLLDLYVQHHKATKLGALFDLATFIDVKIRLNAELDAAAAPRYLYHCTRCEVADAQPLLPMTSGLVASVRSSPSSATSPTGITTTAERSWPPDAVVRRSARGQDGTMRFVFDPEAARREEDTVASFFRDEYEDVEVEVEMKEDSPPPPPPPPRERSSTGPPRGAYRSAGVHDRGGSWRNGPYGSYGSERTYRGRSRYS